MQLAFDTGHKLQDNAVVVGYIEDIHFIWTNMPFMSSSEAKNAYFMIDEYTFSRFIMK